MLYLPVHDVRILGQVLHDLHDLCPSLLVEHTQRTEVSDSLDEWVGKEVSRRRADRGILLETHGEKAVKVLGPGARVMVCEVWSSVRCVCVCDSDFVRQK